MTPCFSPSWCSSSWTCSSRNDPVLFPIVVLIIMDVFLQKMRIKKGRKALIIEEAWKAIASPTMAEYIKYLCAPVKVAS